MGLIFYAGQNLRASQLQKLVPLQVTRVIGQTIINNNTLFDDSVLFFTGLPPNTTYNMAMKVWYLSSTTADFLIQFSCSGTGATLNWSQGGIDSAQTVSSSPDNHTGLSLAQTAIYGGVSAVANPVVMRPEGQLFTGTGSAITFKFRWSQATLDAVNGTTIGGQSQITLTQIP